MSIARKMSEAYWPNRGANDSADRIRGDAEVDKLTLGELVQFYTECQAGPTYCMVTQRVQAQLRLFPPHIEAKASRALDAMEQAKRAFQSLKDAVDNG